MQGVYNFNTAEAESETCEGDVCADLAGAPHGYGVEVKLERLVVQTDR